MFERIYPNLCFVIYIYVWHGALLFRSMRLCRPRKLFGRHPRVPGIPQPPRPIHHPPSVPLDRVTCSLGWLVSVVYILLKTNNSSVHCKLVLQQARHSLSHSRLVCRATPIIWHAVNFTYIHQTNTHTDTHFTLFAGQRLSSKLDLSNYMLYVHIPHKFTYVADQTSALQSIHTTLSVGRILSILAAPRAPAMYWFVLCRSRTAKCILCMGRIRRRRRRYTAFVYGGARDYCV